MEYAITVTNVEPRTLLVAKGHTTFAELPATIGTLLGDVWDYIKAENIAAGISVVLYPNENGEISLCSEAGAPIEVGAELQNLSSDEAEEIEESDDVSVLPNGLSLSTTPGGQVATTTHWGAYDKLTEAHAALEKWCSINRRRIQGTNWEVYGHWTNDPNQLRTDVFYLLEDA